MPGLSARAMAAMAVCVLVPTFAAAQQRPFYGPRVALPDGPGETLVEGVCAACHPAYMITSSAGYSRAGWAELTANMIDLSATPDQKGAILDYLAAHFPPNTRRAAKLLSGPVKIAFTEWKVPTLGQRARDPVEAPDGAIWWVGQFGNILGRLDPRTGAMKEWELPPGTLPHSVTLDRDGTPWFTGNGNGTVGKLDPATGKFTVYKMPDPAARDPHTPIFDRDGVLWFTLQQSNMIGRLDPATGAIRLVTMPRSNAKPYGIKLAADGSLWVACNGANCLVHVDPKTMALAEVKLPDPKTTVRRLDIAADGTIWYVNSARGRLGHYDPKNGAIKEWPSPSGPHSHPYAIAVVDGIVWYNELGVRPDALVRFDPGTETFQSWPIPSGGITAGIVRNMSVTRAGNLLIHQTATNRIIRVTLKHAPTN